MKQSGIWGLFLGMCFSIHPLFAQNFVLEKEPQFPVFQPAYTWGDFVMGTGCQSDLNQLETLPFLSEKQMQLKDKMNTYCMGKITVWDTLKVLFRQNKKTLLIDKTLNEKGTFMRYIKVLPFYLFDVHNTTPKGTGLYAILDKIQNAIQNKNPEQAIFLMQDLSPNEQLFFMPLFNEASSLIDFKQLLSESGVKND